MKLSLEEVEYVGGPMCGAKRMVPTESACHTLRPGARVEGTGVVLTRGYQYERSTTNAKAFNFKGEV